MILNIAYAFSLVKQERSAKMSEAVRCQVSDSGTPPGRVPTSLEPIAGYDWRSIGGRENQIQLTVGAGQLPR
jgi:hypothetical protein